MIQPEARGTVVTYSRARDEREMHRALIGGIWKRPYFEARKRFVRAQPIEKHNEYNVRGAQVK
jgi:hypothetical protein